MERLAVILMVTIVANHNADAYLMELCEADHECPPGYFCYLATTYCAACTDCRPWHRHNSTRSRCSKGVSECGPCYSGFEEEILTNGKPRDLCVPVEKVEEEKKEIGTFSMVALIFMLILLVMLLITIISLIHARKSFHRGIRQIAVIEEPPPYSSLTPVLQNLDAEQRLVQEEIVNEHRQIIMNERERDRDRRDEEVASACGTADVGVRTLGRSADVGVRTLAGTAAVSVQSFNCSWAERKEDSRLQEAVPFCQPTYVNQNTSDPDDSGVSELDGGSGEVTPSWLHDETTMPSEWTPNMISVSENRDMDLDEGTYTEGSCAEATCDRESEDVMMSSDQMSQISQMTRDDQLLNLPPSYHKTQ